MEFREVAFDSREYKSSIALRFDVLRKPLGLNFDPEILKLEATDHHLCAFADNGELVACLVMTPVSDEEVKMRQFAVHSACQRQGIGRALVQYAEQWARAKGYSKIVLHARKTAVPFYEVLSYHTSGEEFVEVSIPHFRMFKNLGHLH